MGLVQLFYSRNLFSRFWVFLFALFSLLPVLYAPLILAEGIVRGDTSQQRIAFSNSYVGSDFRRVMVQNWKNVAIQAQQAGLIKEAPVTSANNSAPEQAKQIQNMVLEGYDAIVILAASDTALKSVVRDACNAGVVVVILASKVSEPCVYEVNYDWDEMGLAEIEYVAGRLQGKGNLLEIRGISGDATDADISAGIHKAAEKYPGLKIVHTVYGQWTSSVAKKEVALALPALPEIDAIVDQGGDGYGAAMAFKEAGRPLPIIVMGNRQNELAFWKQERDANGYKTFSISATPSISQVGFWVTQQILAGKHVPKIVNVPLVTIYDDELDSWLEKMPVGGAANPAYSQEDVVKMIDASVHQ
ncbi:ABC transporter substrate-binding protein [Vibrio mangrovi]|uniref:Autoinducer 2-binding periplasmic protein LuxP n=1 Tax=Vibrio mangrovi TaxID=474394 RepID=A0A1Y6IPN4_9VIBR|nr:ABC transporter substrate-binding protein [Vibrio mangrovi]MDW6003593.1 ABC transporter substrate-binding protein [Vibrio mangrovi]SMR99615.1 Autoinducer 2-binding protein LsrB precursor [Vibrio mangrovi]